MRIAFCRARKGPTGLRSALPAHLAGTARRGKRQLSPAASRLYRDRDRALCDFWLPGAEPNCTDGRWLKAHFAQLWIAVELLLDGTDGKRLSAFWTQMGQTLGIPLVASGDVHMHVRKRRRLQDALTAIRLNVPLREAGAHLYPNGERHLRRAGAAGGSTRRNFSSDTRYRRVLHVLAR